MNILNFDSICEQKIDVLVDASVGKSAYCHFHEPYSPYGGYVTIVCDAPILVLTGLDVVQLR